MIVFSLLLVLASAGLLLAGMVKWLDGASAAHTQPLVWASLVIGALAVLVVAWAVARRRGTAVVEESDHPADQSAGGDVGAVGAWSGGQTAREHPAGRDEVYPAAVGRAEPGWIRADPASAGSSPAPSPPSDEPAVEQPDPADVALLDRSGADRVVVVDGRPRYHLPDCPHLIGRPAIGVDRGDARRAGFTPCGWCGPERRLAQQHRR